MADKKHQNSAQDPEEVIESAINRSEEFFYRNGRSLLIALGVVVVVVGGYFGYKYMVQAPRADKAADMIFVAEQQYAVDSFALALNGDGNNAGFADVAAKYPSTPAGNLAKHYAGVCLVKLGDLDGGMEYLKKYKAVKGVPAQVINAQNLGLQADILSQNGDYKGAAQKYEAAVKAGDNAFTSPYYLKKLGLVYEKLGDGSAAVAAYERITNEYPSSFEARDIEKFVGAAEQK